MAACTGGCTKGIPERRGDHGQEGGSLEPEFLFVMLGFSPEDIHTRARVAIEPKNGGFKITHIHLDTEAVVPGTTPEKFREIAEAARRGCPVSQALAGTQITLDARLAGKR